MKLREHELKIIGDVGVFIYDMCDGDGGWYEPHVFDDTPIELSEWVECIGCHGHPEGVYRVLPDNNLQPVNVAIDGWRNRTQ